MFKYGFMCVFLRGRGDKYKNLKLQSLWDEKLLFAFITGPWYSSSFLSAYTLKQFLLNSILPALFTRHMVLYQSSFTKNNGLQPLMIETKAKIKMIR